MPDKSPSPAPQPPIDDALGAAIKRAVWQPEVLAALAAGLEAQIRQHLGGGSVYIGKRGTREQQRERDRLIAMQFTGDNYVTLAKEYGLHPRQIRRIVHPRRPTK